MKPSEMTDEQLVRAVAEEVMGWKPPKTKPVGRYVQVLEDEDLKIGKVIGWRSENGKFYDNKEWDDYHYWRDSDGEIVKIDGRYQYGRLDFYPLTNANHRDMVVEAMRTKGWWCRTLTMTISYEVEFYESKRTSGYSWDDNLGRATCEAALEAVRGGDAK